MMKVYRKVIIGLTTFSDSTRFQLHKGYIKSVIYAEASPLLIPASQEIINDVDTYMSIIDALIVSGGNDVSPEFYQEKLIFEESRINISRNLLEMEMIKQAIAMKMPVLAINGGMQLLNVLLGGTLYQDIDLQYANNVVDHRKEHPIDINKESKIYEILQVERIRNVPSRHHQAIKKLSDELVVTARSPEGLTEAVEHRLFPNIIGVQFNPELTEENNILQRLFFHLKEEAVIASAGG